MQGVLFAMRGQLTSADYWRSNDRGTAASSFLQLLAVIIPRQPLLHAQVQSCSTADPFCCTIHC